MRGSPTITGSTTRGRRTSRATVDIHRKPGYDPVELFVDPALQSPEAEVAWRLLQKKLGFRMLMDVMPLDASLVRGSHGRADTSYARGPVVMSSEAGLLPEGAIDAADVKQLMLDHVFGRRAEMYARTTKQPA